MGYQEYIYKIEDIDNAKKNKEKIQNYLRKKNYGTLILGHMNVKIQIQFQA
jgi:hypothetical protein